MTPEAVLARYAEPGPDWLAQWTARSRFPRDAFFSSRVVIYPGGGGDGHAFKVFGGSHAAHCFIHPDYGVSRETVLSWLAPESPEKLRGYRALGHVDLTMADLIPDGWHPPAFLSAEEKRGIAEGELQQLRSIKPYAMFIVFDREESLDDQHGPTRLAVVFLSGTAQITYHALFCQRGCAAPFGMLLQNHGFGGGNFDPLHFREGSLLHRFARQADKLPRFILGEEAWSGYKQLTDEPSVGGMHSNRRHLFERSEDAAPSGSRGK